MRSHGSRSRRGPRRSSTSASATSAPTSASPDGMSPTGTTRPTRRGRVASRCGSTRPVTATPSRSPSAGNATPICSPRRRRRSLSTTRRVGRRHPARRCGRDGRCVSASTTPHWAGFVLFRGIVDAVAQPTRPTRATPWRSRRSAPSVRSAVSTWPKSPPRRRRRRGRRPTRRPHPQRRQVSGVETCSSRRRTRRARRPGTASRSPTCSHVVAESTGGAVYGDTDGRVVFRGRDWQMFLTGPPRRHRRQRRRRRRLPVGVPAGASPRRPGHPDHLGPSRRRHRCRSPTTTRPARQLYGVEPFKAADLDLFLDDRARTHCGTAVPGPWRRRLDQRVERVLIDAATTTRLSTWPRRSRVYDPPSRLPLPPRLSPRRRVRRRDAGRPGCVTR